MSDCSTPREQTEALQARPEHARPGEQACLKRGPAPSRESRQSRWGLGRPEAVHARDAQAREDRGSVLPRRQGTQVPFPRSGRWLGWARSLLSPPTLQEQDPQTRRHRHPGRLLGRVPGRLRGPRGLRLDGQLPRSPKDTHKPPGSELDQTGFLPSQVFHRGLRCPPPDPRDPEVGRHGNSSGSECLSAPAGGSGERQPRSCRRLGDQRESDSTGWGDALHRLTPAGSPNTSQCPREGARRKSPSKLLRNRSPEVDKGDQRRHQAATLGDAPGD